jgi:transposase
MPRLEPRRRGCLARAGQGREKGGQQTGPNPTDRARTSTKRHLLTDGQGIPLAVLITPGNRNEITVFAALLDAVPPVRGKPGRPRRRPAKLYADKAYDFPAARRALRARGIQARIARRGIDSSARLGRHRWVVERTFAHLNQMRRLTVRYERRADIYAASLLLGCALLAFNHLARSSSRLWSTRP